MTLSLPLSIINSLEDTLLFLAPDKDMFAEAKLSDITRAILLRQWEEFIMQSKAIKFDPLKHCTEDLGGDELERLAHDWAMVRAGESDAILDEMWGKWSKKLKDIIKYQGTLNLDYDYDTKIVSINLVR